MALSLPQATSLTYYAEGAANVLYKIGIPAPSIMEELPPSEIEYYGPATPQPTELEPWEIDLGAADYSYLKGKLLRLRKDLPTATSVLEAQKSFLEHIAPLFKENEVVEQELIEISEEIIAQLNSVLVAMDDGGHRPEERRSVYLSQAEYGLLVQEMSSRSGQDSVTVEIKPKWLAQSPNAPKGAKRCRTCALHAQRKAAKTPSSKSATEACTFCPLDLVSGEEARVSRAVREILRGNQVTRTQHQDIEGRLVTYFLTSSLLNKLKHLQQKLDPMGILHEGSVDRDLLTAMTLRDCTLYLKVPLAQTGAIEARVGDLDLKSPLKIDYWKSVEHRLTSQSWYEIEANGKSLAPCGLLS